jgi:hypothetical protein
LEATVGPLQALDPVTDGRGRTWQHHTGALPGDQAIDHYAQPLPDQRSTIYVAGQFASDQLDDAAADLMPRLLEPLTFEPAGCGGPSLAGRPGDHRWRVPTR